MYKNFIDGFRQIYRQEGIHGLQRGLTPSLIREGSKNLFRMGLYDPLIQAMHDEEQRGTSAPVWKRIVAASFCGAAGAVIANPFELAKTRLQAQSNSTVNGHTVKHQHGWERRLQVAFPDSVQLHWHDGRLPKDHQSSWFVGTLPRKYDLDVAFRRRDGHPSYVLLHGKGGPTRSRVPGCCFR